jgi:hypothetical protein
VGAGQRPPEELTPASRGGELRYRLGDAVAPRARATALVGAASSVAPVLLSLVLLYKLGFDPFDGRARASWVAPVVGALLAAVALATVARALIVYKRAAAGLARYEARFDADSLVIETAGAPLLRVPRGSVARVTEVGGAFGGLRLELVGASRDSAVSIPRGGERFGEVRSRLEEWRTVEPARRRGRVARLVIGALVIAAIFFVPFALDDLAGRSKALAVALVLSAWLVTRRIVRRA